MKKFLVILACAAVLAMLVAPAVATGAYSTNAECLSCHPPAGAGAISPADFGAAKVDLARCNACHWMNMGTYVAGGSGSFAHTHMAEKGCTGCHGFGTADTSRLPVAYTPYGNFASITSPAGGVADPARLHAIHVNGSMPQNMTWPGLTCKNCHGSAACSACHGPAPVHTTHSNTSPQWALDTYSSATGAAYAPATISCTQARCHTRAAAGTAAFTPFCGATCHTDKLGDHGYGGTDHTATVGATALGTTGKTCGDCHAMDLMSEHARASTSGARSCLTCHPTPAPPVAGSWTKSCSQTFASGSCHTTHINPQHTADLTVAHAVLSTGPSTSCTTADCHPGDLVSLHSLATTTVAGVTRTSCSVCHSKTQVPTTADCTSCHAGHGDITALHTATPWTALFQDPSGAVPRNGYECSKCHSAALTAAHATTSVSGGSVTCAECHANTSLNSRAVVTSSWASKRCTECHNYGTNVTHSGYAAAHGPLGGTCAGTAVGCHTATDLVTLHDRSQSGGAPKYNTCLNGGCHTRDHRPSSVNLANSCGQDSGGCHDNKTTTNHGGAHTLDVTGSNYDNSSLSGCTNSGNGCHLSESRGAAANYQNPYHLASGCTTGPCHTSADKASHHNPLTCQACHDGSYASAPNVSQLVGLPASGGHYDETLHTAAASNLTGLVSSGGTITAACTKCHNNAPIAGLKQLNAQHQGLPAPYGTTTCADCHDFNDAVSNVVKTSWPGRECIACHTAAVMPNNVTHGTTAPAVLGTSADGCGASGAGCHTTYDLHALHKGTATSSSTMLAAGCALSGCHDFGKQALKPTAKTCGTGGACHTTDPHDSAAHIAANSATCVTALCHPTTPAGDVLQLHAGAAAGKCAVCHNNPTKGNLTTGKSTVDCAQSGCHLDTGGHKLREPFTNCAKSGCHGPGGAHIHSGRTHSGLACTTCHGASAPGCTKSGCHSADSIHSRSAHESQPCTTCHTSGAQTVPEPYTTCGDCHGTSNIHSESHHDNVSCTSCHSPTPACMNSGCHTQTGIHSISHHQDAGCTKCHISGVAKPHTTITSKLGTSDSNWRTVCGSCHGRTHTRSSCYKCHSDDAHGRSAHYRAEYCVKCHNISSTDQAKKLDCLMCHPSSGSSSWGGGGWGGR